MTHETDSRGPKPRVVLPHLSQGGPILNTGSAAGLWGSGELSPAYVFLAAPCCASYISGIVLPVTGSVAGA